MSIACWKDNLKENLNQFEIISHHPDVFYQKGLKLATISFWLQYFLKYETDIYQNLAYAIK